jgi:hypothetical protein
VVTLTVPITTTPASKNALALQTIPTVTVRTAAPQLGMELLPVQQQAYQKEQQAQIQAQQTDTEEQESQHQDELASK